MYDTVFETTQYLIENKKSLNTFMMNFNQERKTNLNVVIVHKRNNNEFL